MDKTVTCLFNSEAQASTIVSRLEDAGLSRGKVCMFSNSGNNRFWDDASSFTDESGSDQDRIERYLMNNGVPADDAHAYAEGVRRGHTLVAVRCDDNEVDWVVDILDDDNVLDLDERQESWRSEGWRGYGSGAAGLGDAQATANTSPGIVGDAGMSGRRDMRDESRLSSEERLRGAETGRDEVIPVAEEELHVGKREVSRGRVRIRSHVTERPVQEQVTLSQEHVQVERRAAEGSGRPGAMDNDDLFRERTIEVEERGEEPVVSKEARVVEEVVVRKEADQRTETVSDTVRKTEVDVEDERGNAVTRTGTTDTDR